MVSAQSTEISLVAVGVRMAATSFPKDEACDEKPYCDGDCGAGFVDVVRSSEANSRTQPVSG
jgi:hypothetical protein